MVGLMAVGCRHPDGETYPGAPIVLISIDTLRSDHLPAYGYKGVATPAIDSLRRDSLLFERVYSQVPMTLPSHVSLLTGELPPVHGVRDNSGFPFDVSKHSFLPRLLKAAGYDTGAVVSATVLAGGTGLGAGFDSYDDRIPGAENFADEPKRSGEESARAALAWVKGRASGRPFFLFLHLYDPHAPYRPPEPWASRYQASPYDGEIAAADAAVGTMLDGLRGLGLYDRAVVVLLSDHGEGLGEHGEKQHGMYLYRETLQVPLLLKLPGAKLAGSSVAAPAQLVDVMPTLCRLAGLKTPAGSSGRNLLDLAGEKAARPIYSETLGPRLHFGWSELTSLIEGRLHLQDGPRPELFDLAADPGETSNRLGDERRAYAAMRQAIQGIYRPPAPPQPVDAETARKLAALGYVAASGSLARGPLPDPRDKRADVAALDAGMRAAGEQRWEAAAPIFERLAAANPRMADVQVLLARAYRQLGKPDEAARHYHQALTAADGAPATALLVAQELLGLGRAEEARTVAELARAAYPAESAAIAAQCALTRREPEAAFAELRRAGERAAPALRRAVGVALADAGRSGEALALLQPLAGGGDPETLDAIAIALADSGRDQEAVAVLGPVLAAKPRDARAHQVLGAVALHREQPDEARRQLELAVGIDPRLAVAWNGLGVARFRLEGAGAALAAWHKAVEIDPNYFDALLNIGMVSAAVGQKSEARQALQRFVAKAPPSRFGADLVRARTLLRELGG